MCSSLLVKASWMASLPISQSNILGTWMTIDSSRSVSMDLASDDDSFEMNVKALFALTRRERKHEWMNDWLNECPLITAIKVFAELHATVDGIVAMNGWWDLVISFNVHITKCRNLLGEDGFICPWMRIDRNSVFNDLDVWSRREEDDGIRLKWWWWLGDGDGWMLTM